MSGRSKFGVGGANLDLDGANLVWVEQFEVGGADVGRTMWRVADYLEKTLCNFLFSWAKF